MTEELTVRAAIIAPATFTEDLTVEVVFSTGSPVNRSDFEGPYIERLDMSPASVDLSRLRGAPVLNDHSRTGVESIIGVVEEASVDGTRGVAKLRLSSRPEVQGIVADIRAGIIRNVSAGYSVEKWAVSKGPDGLRTKTAVRWTPKEISFTPLAADPLAQTRSLGANMQEQIRSIATACGVNQAFADDLVQRNVSLEDARTAIIIEAARNSPRIESRQPPTVIRENSPEDMVRAASDALYSRVDAKHVPSDIARPFVGRSMASVARELLRLRGLGTLGSDAEIVTRSLTTTSDLSNIVGLLAGKTAAMAYQAAPGGVKTVCRQGPSHQDFKGRSVVRRGELPALEKVNEKGEFKRGAISDEKQTYSIATYGKVFGMTRQALINDDLALLVDIPAGWGNAAVEFVNQLLVDLLTSNSGGGPKLSDAVNLFHASHGNLAASGAVISDTTLSAARLALRTMKDLSGVPINVTPRYLLVPAALETLAEKWLTGIMAQQATNVNPFGGVNKLELVVDPRLDAKSATAYYVFADPSQVPVIEYAYLSGFEGVSIESRAGWDVDGVELRARLDFGAGPVDSRGAYRNPGA